MYVNSSFSISFFPKPTLIRLFSSFSVETALDRSLLTSKYLNSQSILSSHCVWPINSIWHSWFLISPFFTFGFQNTTHFCPPPPPLLISSCQFPLLFLPFSSLKLEFSLGILCIFTHLLILFVCRLPSWYLRSLSCRAIYPTACLLNNLTRLSNRHLEWKMSKTKPLFFSS